MRSITRFIGATAAILLLTGCAGNAPDTTTDGVNTAPTRDSTAEPEPEVFRESIGLFRATDPATPELAALLKADHIALDLTLFTGDEIVEITTPVEGAPDSANLGFFLEDGEGDFLTLTVPEAALTIGDIDEGDALSTLRGVFGVEPSNEADVDYVLTLIGEVHQAETTDEQRCAEEETLLADAETLADDPSTYEAVRERWMDSPRMWWAVKATAHFIAEYGDTGDSMATACAIY